MNRKYQGHSPTSREAAFFAEAFSGSAREQVFLQIVKVGNATDEEIQEALKMNPSTQRPRRVELVEAGLVEDSGYTRETASGMQAVIWRATGTLYSHSYFLTRAQLKARKREAEKTIISLAHKYAERASKLNETKLLIAARNLK